MSDRQCCSVICRVFVPSIRGVRSRDTAGLADQDAMLGIASAKTWDWGTCPFDLDIKAKRWRFADKKVSSSCSANARALL